MAHEKALRNSNSTKELSSKRGGYVRSMAVEWIRLHRPDVMMVITEESRKTFPLAGRERKKFQLTEKLASLK